MTRIHHGRITRGNFTALKILWAPPIHSPPCPQPLAAVDLFTAPLFFHNFGLTLCGKIGFEGPIQSTLPAYEPCG